MKRITSLIGTLFLVLILVGMGSILIAILREQQATVDIGSPTSPLATITLVPPKSSSGTPVPTVVSPSSTAPGSPYPPPLPTNTPVPSPTLVVLPPLPTFPVPGPFSGMRVLYTKSNPPGYYTNNLDGTDEIKLPAGRLSEQFGGPGPGSRQISPDGTKMLHLFWDAVAPEVSIPTSIWTSDPDGSNSQLLVAFTEEWFPQDPIWSPDGKRIAYQRAYLLTSYREGAMVRSFELWVMDVDGNNNHLVTADPAFGPDIFGGQALVFRWLNNGYIYFVNHDRQLYAVNPGTGQLYQLMNSVDPLDIRVSLSPDGQHIVASNDLPAQAIERKGLIPIDIPGQLEGWSADGRYLIYNLSSSDSEQRGLWMRDLITGQDRRLVSDPFSVNSHLSPDSRYLAYQTDEGLFVIDVESNKAQLVMTDLHDPTTGDRAIRFLAWLPVP